MLVLSDIDEFLLVRYIKHIRNRSVTGFFHQMRL